MSSGSWEILNIDGPLNASKEWYGSSATNRRDFTSYSVKGWRCVAAPAIDPYGSGWPTYGPADVWRLNFPEKAVLWAQAQDGNAVLKALDKLGANVAAHNFNAGIFIAELPQAVSLLKGATVACFKLLNAVRLCNWDHVLRALVKVPQGPQMANLKRAVGTGDISRVWIAIQFGWIPLIKDFQAAQKAVQTILDRPERRSLKFHGSAESLKTINIRTSGDSVSIYVPHKQRISITVNMKALPNELQMLGLTDMASVVWEKVPWSFAVDWFIPVGNYLRGWSVVNMLDAEYCIVQHDSCDFDYVPGRVVNYEVLRDWGGKYKGSMFKMERTVSSGCPVPLPSLKSWQKSLTNTHLLDAAALIQQLVATYTSTKVGGRDRVSQTAFSF